MLLVHTGSYKITYACQIALCSLWLPKYLLYG